MKHKEQQERIAKHEELERVVKQLNTLCRDYSENHNIWRYYSELRTEKLTELDKTWDRIFNWYDYE